VARLTCVRANGSKEIIEAEMSRQRLKELELSAGDAVLLRMRRARRFAEDFTI
jgi:hypothetical protein